MQVHRIVNYININLQLWPASHFKQKLWGTSASEIPVLMVYCDKPYQVPFNTNKFNVIELQYDDLWVYEL
jgi:hypothetical protein